jgi:hypothetical protein
VNRISAAIPGAEVDPFSHLSAKSSAAAGPPVAVQNAVLPFM